MAKQGESHQASRFFKKRKTIEPGGGEKRRGEEGKNTTECMFAGGRGIGGPAKKKEGEKISPTKKKREGDDGFVGPRAIPKQSAGEKKTFRAWEKGPFGIRGRCKAPAVCAGEKREKKREKKKSVFETGGGDRHWQRRQREGGKKKSLSLGSPRKRKTRDAAPSGRSSAKKAWRKGKEKRATDRHLPGVFPGPKRDVPSGGRGHGRGTATKRGKKKKKRKGKKRKSA